MASLTVLGAAEGVTGSCYLIECEQARVVLECGLVRGSDKEELVNAEPFDFDVSSIDAVVLSHGHLDHSGRLPRLVAAGYAGAIHATPATGELLEVLLKDAASLARRDAEWENKRLRRAGKKEVPPLFSLEDVYATLDLLHGVDYGTRESIAPGGEVRFRDAGHILGSAIVELFITEQGVERTLLFSGDLGNSDAALLRPPERVTGADLVLMESTYGDREHRPMSDTLDEFAEIIRIASANKGNVLIPSFAIGRTQEILFRLGELYQAGKLKHQAVFLDSPMAIAATEVYHRYQDSFDEKHLATMRAARAGSLHTFLPTLRYSSSTEESMALNRIESGAIIIAGSGMCNGGRIRHHLIHNLWKSSAHVIIVGYQAQGTPGRALVDGVQRLRLGGKDIAVKASIHTMGGFSAHAGRSQLLDWARTVKRTDTPFALIHGDPDAKTALREALVEAGRTVVIPATGVTLQI